MAASTARTGRRNSGVAPAWPSKPRQPRQRMRCHRRTRTRDARALTRPRLDKAPPEGEAVTAGLAARRLRQDWRRGGDGSRVVHVHDLLGVVAVGHTEVM